MKNYTLKSVEIYISKYVNEYGGILTQLEEGVLGIGKIMLHGVEGRKIVIITEFFINSWQSGHKLRMYNKMPKKYQNH
jgi:hypothetical protein